MANFFTRTLTSLSTGAISLISSLKGDPFKVTEVKQSQLQQMTITNNIENFTLYYNDGFYICVVTISNVKLSRYYIFFKLQDDVVAVSTFKMYQEKLQPIINSCKKAHEKEILQKLSNSLRENQGWFSIHLCAYLGLTEYFDQPDNLLEINQQCSVTKVTPIMISIKTENILLMKDLLKNGAIVELADVNGDNVFHYAAKIENNEILQVLVQHNSKVINQLNITGEGPLHTACQYGFDKNVETLLKHGGKHELDLSPRFPIHCAVMSNSLKSVEILLKWDARNANLKHKDGSFPVHLCDSVEMIALLCDYGADINAVNKNNETALHILIKKEKLDCVMCLLPRCADPSIEDMDGNNALHIALMKKNSRLIKALIVFGADINAKNKCGISPRHIAANNSQEDGGKVLYILHRIGAQKCPPETEGCVDGCGHWSKFNGIAPEKEATTPIEDILKKEYFDAVMLNTIDAVKSQKKDQKGDRVLCLDGGGIRGLLLIQMLMAIEKLAKKPIREIFDWIAGTSTGGILALYLSLGKSLKAAQSMYMTLKNETFKGQRPYDTNALDKFMKKEFGELTTMSEIEGIKVIVTATLVDRFPPDLHLFTNYEKPGYNYMKAKHESSLFVPPRPSDVPIWKAARSSAAAPTYFRSMDQFMDGGLLSNNPTLDVLTEIHEYNCGILLQKNEKQLSIKQASLPLHVVVSLGCGMSPTKSVNAFDVYKPVGLADFPKVAIGLKSLIETLVESATECNRRSVERARAWCSSLSIPFFRFCPNVSENIPLDCTDDDQLINMLWETQVYIHDHYEELKKLVAILN